MDVCWITAFIDLPEDDFGAGTAFWLGATGTSLSPPRGDGGEFATLVPPAGDPFLRVQRLGNGPARIHLDLHTPDVTVAAAEAVALGATVVAEPGYVSLTSPGGFPFCIVPHRGEAQRPAPVSWPDGTCSLVDQVCLDVPPRRADVEIPFWSALTGWEHRAGAAAGLSVLVRPVGQPLRILFQVLDDDEPTVRAHLDLAGGPDVDTLAGALVQRGARPHHAGPRWRTLADPAGSLFCVTERDPETGLLPPAPS